MLHPMLGFYKKIRARFWRMFREPVNLDECREWPRYLAEGDYYRSPNNSFGQKYEIFNGVWTPKN
jgi:hypothetical protein